MTRDKKDLTDLEFLTDCDLRFFGKKVYSPSLVTTNFCKKVKVAISVLSVKFSQKLAKFVPKNGIATLATLFAIFELTGENIFSKIKYRIYFSQTISKYPFKVAMVAISNNGDL